MELFFLISYCNCSFLCSTWGAKQKSKELSQVGFAQSVSYEAFSPGASLLVRPQIKWWAPLTWHQKLPWADWQRAVSSPVPSLLLQLRVCVLTGKLWNHFREQVKIEQVFNMKYWTLKPSPKCWQQSAVYAPFYYFDGFSGWKNHDVDSCSSLTT